MFGAAFNLVTRVGLPLIFGTLKDGSLEINNLALKIVSATETSSKMVPPLCQKWF